MKKHTFIENEIITHEYKLSPYSIKKLLLQNMFDKRKHVILREFKKWCRENIKTLYGGSGYRIITNGYYNILRVEVTGTETVINGKSIVNLFIKSL